MMRALFAFIDRTTMFMLVLYYLLVLLAAAIVLSALGVLSLSPMAIIVSAVVLIAAAQLANMLFARVLGVTANRESALITGLILALILPPIGFGHAPELIALALVAAGAMGSKYVIAYNDKHILNPAAFGAAFSYFVFGIPATWWIGGNLALLPFVLIGGLMVVQKIRRWEMVSAFFAVALVTTAATAVMPASSLQETVLHSAFFFLAFAMLTEPLTMPPTRSLQVFYGALVGLLFAPNVHIGSFYTTPEIALLVGNVYAYIVSPKARYTLRLVDRVRKAEGVFEFLFASDKPLRHEAGQYMEWTLAGVPFDVRGNRRFFTIASAPEDRHVALGVRFYAEPSAFKERLAKLQRGAVIHAGQVAGDFTLPRSKKKKIVCIAGGIGVTPFASMARHLIAAKEKRDLVLLYSAKRTEDVAYTEVFADAEAFGVQPLYAVTEEKPREPGYYHGPITAEVITRAVPDFAERVFYVSGPPGMVDGMRGILRDLGVSRRAIKTDYFPGLA